MGYLGSMACRVLGTHCGGLGHRSGAPVGRARRWGCTVREETYDAICWSIGESRDGHPPWSPRCPWRVRLRSHRHHIICEIAFQELNPQVRARVIQLLQRDSDFSLFSKACTWPDHPRMRAREHFVNLSRSACWYEADNEALDLDEANKVVTVDEAYMDAHLPTITQRLTQAGIRLGHLLNRALGGG